MKINTVTGWSLDCASLLDEHRPGFAGHFLRASAERRQVIAAYLSTRPWTGLKTDAQQDDQIDLASEAQLLSSADHRAIITEGFGQCPDGFRGALKRAGTQPLERPFYSMLFRVMADPANASAARALKQLSKITPVSIIAARTLPHDLRHAPLVAVIDDLTTARDLTAAYNLMRDNGADPKVFAEALKRVGKGGGLADLLHRWALRLPFPAHPIPASEQFKPVTSGIELSKIALQYRNCARSLVYDILDGKSALGEFRWRDQTVLIHLSRSKDEWITNGFYAYRNRQVPDDIEVQANAFLHQHGMGWTDPNRDRDSAWYSLRRLTALREFRL